MTLVHIINYYYCSMMMQRSALEDDLLCCSADFSGLERRSSAPMEVVTTQVIEYY